MGRFKAAQDIKVGTIGYGGAFNMGRAHFNEMKQAGMTPVAVAELDADRRKVAEQEFPGIQTFASVEAMLAKSDVNLLAILTPHNSHAPLAIQCLKAGRHVVTEKPFAVTTAECDAMIRAAKQRRLLLSTYHNRHWDGCILEATRRILKERAIGEVMRIEAHMGGYSQPGDWWRSSKSISGGVLYDWGVHLLEYSLQLIDSQIVEVTGFAHRGFWAPKTRWKTDTNEDEGFAAVRFKSGAWLTLCITHLDANPKRGILEITGTEGSYIVDHGTFELIQPQGGGQSLVTRGRNPQSQGQEFYRNIAAHLVQGERLIITPEWARRPIHILDLANASAGKGCALKARYA
jgi:scyllo-inositol 2-dehydrogenase (NADP+)